MSECVLKRLACRGLRVGLFIFELPGFFRGFYRQISSPRFCGKKCAEKPSRKKPRQNRPKFIQQKSPTHFCRVAGPKSGDFIAI